MCSMMQIPQQQDSSSCGIIMLYLCEKIISFAERCNYNFSVLNELKAADLSIEVIIRSAHKYRLRLGYLLRSIFVCGIQCSSDEQEGNNTSSVFHTS